MEVNNSRFLDSSNIFRNKKFDYDIIINNNNFFETENPKEKSIEFHNCTFNKDLYFEYLNNEKLTISFINCTFKGTCQILNSTLKDLNFKNIVFLKRMELHTLNLEKLTVNSGNKNISSDFNIGDVHISKLIDCSFLKIEKGIFNFLTTYSSKKEITYLNTWFNNSSFDRAFFGGTYLSYIDFSKSKFNSVEFSSCHFDTINFTEANFGLKSRFQNCNFNSVAKFTNCFNKGLFEIADSKFKELVYFDESNLSQLNIKNTSFEKKAFFDRLTINSLSLYQTTFSQGTFFDELKIKNITDKKYIKSITGDEALKLRRTLRQIKQELQKAENKIDYNRFRGYELHAYYQELKWKQNFKDKAILWATKWSTGFEHSWTKALRFVLTGALIFYSLFFISEKYMLALDLNLSSIKDFVSGYFRFLIVTDFYNPLEQERIFIDNSNTTGWIIFILGKIVLAFGIYEMIQAFRKFKA